MCLRSIKAFIKINNLRIALLPVLLIAMGNSAYAQLCTGSLGDPVVKIDFGAGTSTHAGALAAGTTSYTYTSADFPNDGSYTVENSTAGSGNVWWSTTDHTGNTGGYMMVVNASVSKTDYFYKSTVTGLCPGTTFEFAAWITNLLRSSDISPPNITFTISTTTGTVLATYNTGTIPLTPSGRVWKQYGTYFTTPAGISTVVIQMTNNSNGGAPANDLALDDITFRPCGPVLSSTFVSGTSSSITQTGCAGTNQSYTLNATVSAGAYTNPTYQWQVNTGSAWVNIAGANATSYTVNFQPAVAGVYKYRMVASEAANAGSTICQVASNELTLTVSNAPTSAFVIANSNSSCLVNTVSFRDASNGNGQAITSWLWDFGDGQTSTVASPTHTFEKPGDYPVKLTVGNGTSCPATSSQTIHLTAKLVAGFTAAAQSCPNVPVTFTDNSTYADPIIKWEWSFGDNTAAVVKTDNTPVEHTFANSGTYSVSLQITSSTGCVSDLFKQDITILGSPVVDFILPDACLTDVAQFTDASTISDGTAANFTYLWDFGDATNSTAANPNTSTAKNPTHKYSSIGNYNVTLTVTAQSGCAPVTTSKVFTVNGTNPGPAFTISTPDKLCSGDSVAFVEASHPNFGNVSKLVWYFDYDNQPTVGVTYDKAALRSDKTYRHLYPVNNTSTPQIYHVVLEAYSGQSCVDRTGLQEVKIYPNPTAVLMLGGSVLSSPTELCNDADAITITAQPNVAGTGVFNGTGITAAGVFDPKLLTPGTYTITYVFSAADGGCMYTTSFDVVVNALPAITLASTATVLEGGQIRVNPSVAGTGLTYTWTPTTGISNAAILNPYFSPTEDTEYTLTVTSDKTCMAAASVTIHVLKTPVVPNAFTPNNDGINDTWYIQYLDTYPNATVDVFNRYGQKVYSSIGYPIPWDGTSKGAELPFGVYYYIIDPKSGAKKLSGSLTIIR